MSDSAFTDPLKVGFVGLGIDEVAEHWCNCLFKYIVTDRQTDLLTTDGREQLYD